MVVKFWSTVLRRNGINRTNQSEQTASRARRVRIRFIGKGGLKNKRYISVMWQKWCDMFMQGRVETGVNVGEVLFSSVSFLDACTMFGVKVVAGYILYCMWQKSCQSNRNLGKMGEVVGGEINKRFERRKDTHCLRNVEWFGMFLLIWWVEIFVLPAFWSLWCRTIRH